MKVQEIRELITLFHYKASSMRRFYQTPTYMGLLNVGRLEVAHSHFLSWLFSESSFNQSSPDSPLMHLLDIAVNRANMQNKIGNIGTEALKSSTANSINCRKLTILESRCRLEDFTKEKSGKGRRADIIVESKVIEDDTVRSLNICIENKVLSSEHTDQTIAYANNYRNKNGEWIFLFLTPLSSVQLNDFDSLEDDNKCASNLFIQINYQDILDYILEPLLKAESPYSQNYFIIDDYIKTLKYPVMEEKEFKKTIMAIGEEESKLLNDFWEGNRELIELAVMAISKKGNEEVVNNANDLINAIQNLENARKDTTRFRVIKKDGSRDDKNGKGYTKSDIAKLFATEICKKNNCTDEDSANKFFKKIVNTSRAKIFDQEAAHKYEIIINGVSVFLNTNIWGLNTDCWQNMSNILLKDNEYFKIEPLKDSN